MPNPSGIRNPLFNDNKFKIGTFATNTIGSWYTVAPEAYEPNWENSLRVAKLADRAGFEAILGLARWKIPGDYPIDGRGNIVLDSFTWTAALAMATRYSALFATTHAPTVHPLVIAKQAATIDQISGGRFGLNVVGGWNRPEFAMFGIDLLEHDRRYDYLDEWISVLYRLWESKEPFDFKGEFLKLDGALSRPLPVQKPRPPVINAGISPRGRRFACEHADCCFVTSDMTKEEIASYRKLAREEFGREIGVWMQIPIVQRKTRAEAEEALNYFGVEQEDVKAVDGVQSGAMAESRSLTNETVRLTRRMFATGGAPLIGTAQDIADQIEALSENGVDGILSAWFDFEDGLPRLIDEVFPKLEQRGLRKAFAPVEPAGS